MALDTAGSVAITYFWQRSSGSPCFSKLTDVTVFCPASGVAAGILIMLGRDAFPALVLGVVIGTFAAKKRNELAQFHPIPVEQDAPRLSNLKSSIARHLAIGDEPLQSRLISGPAYRHA